MVEDGGGAGTGESSKIQVPSSKETPNFKFLFQVFGGGFGLQALKTGSFNHGWMQMNTD